MDGPAHEEKSSFKMLGLSFYSKLDWGSYIISIAKTASKKIGALIHSMKNLSLQVDLYFYKSAIHSFMEYCCLVCVGAPSYYLAHCRNVARLSLFCRYYFVRCLSELAELFPLLYSWGKSTC